MTTPRNKKRPPFLYDAMLFRHDQALRAYKRSPKIKAWENNTLLRYF